MNDATPSRIGGNQATPIGLMDQADGHHDLAPSVHPGFKQIYQNFPAPVRYPAAWTLVMAVSRDGYFAIRPNDDMKWTGKADKDLFRLLTISLGPTLLAGHRTWDLMPPLQGRRVVPLSALDMPLHVAALTWPHAVLIGGPSIAAKAIAGGYVQRTILNEIQVDVHPLIEDLVWSDCTPTQKDLTGALVMANHKKVSSLHYTGPLQGSVVTHVWHRDDV